MENGPGDGVDFAGLLCLDPGGQPADADGADGARPPVPVDLQADAGRSELAALWSARDGSGDESESDGGFANGAGKVLQDGGGASRRGGVAGVHERQPEREELGSDLGDGSRPELPIAADSRLG